MSDFSLTLVLQIKTSKIINDMAKVQQRSEKISAFGGIFFVLDSFDRILSSVIDSHLGLRSKLIGYQSARYPADFINLYRIRHAAKLLSTTDDPIGLIIEQSGITNRASFSRIFREHYSMSPSEYRKAAK